MKDKIFFYCIKVLMFPIGFLSYKVIHILGKSLGCLSFYFLTKYRKRTLSNLSLATDLKLSNKQLLKTAKKSFQNLAINILEYPRLYREKNFEKIVICNNPEIAQQLYSRKQGIIFFCGHQANWEVLFLDGNLRMKGIAIGKPIKNKLLYKWITSIREKTGGKIIHPQKALKEGLKNLKQGNFMGIVGDQGMPSSNYSFPFLGRKAWNSTAPALLSYKTNSPIIVATTIRKKSKYYINYSDPIWPNLKNPVDKEVIRLMNKSLFILQESIKENTDQWLWQHNRWKQQTPKIIKKRFRHDCLGIILPKEGIDIKALLILKKLYFKDFISIFIHENHKKIPISVNEVFTYKNLKETLKFDFRFKLIFNFTDNEEIKKHYKKLSAIEVLSIKDLKKIAFKKTKQKNSDVENILIKALCQPNVNFYAS